MAENERGFLSLVLHAHLPFVRHPEYDDFLEERWLFEAITETYLPLLERLGRIQEERIPARLTVSFTPTLLAMLADPLLQARYGRYIGRFIELAEKEIRRTRWVPPFNRLALFYHHRATEARRLYHDIYRQDLISAFRGLIRGGIIEPLASCATHAVLPLLEPSTAAVRAQILVGVEAFTRAFGQAPAGFWLPECGYARGHEAILKEAGIRYFLVDAHGILFGDPRPRYGVYAPVRCANGVAVFGRDLACSRSVWSSTEGYPGNPDYREFHRDIGHELDYEYLKPYLNGDGSRVSTGIKYYRVTGKTETKIPYDPDRGLAAAGRDASQFLADRVAQLRALQPHMDRPAVITAPFDAELFGHWWFEGPDWLDLVIRKAAAEAPGLTLASPGDCLSAGLELQELQPSPSSWGSQGYHEVWLSGANDWIYRKLEAMAKRLSALAESVPEPLPLQARLLNQMARELFLAQASDWAFILKAQTHTSYAYRRLQDHMERFEALSQALENGSVDESRLSEIEAKDNLFPFVDYRVFAGA